MKQAELLPSAQQLLANCGGTWQDNSGHDERVARVAERLQQLYFVPPLRHERDEASQHALG